MGFTPTLLKFTQRIWGTYMKPKFTWLRMQVLWSLPPNFWTQAWPRPHRILYVSKLVRPHELAILQGSKEHQLLALRPGRKLLPAASHAWRSFWYLGSLRFRHRQHPEASGSSVQKGQVKKGPWQKGSSQQILTCCLFLRSLAPTPRVYKSLW